MSSSMTREERFVEDRNFSWALLDEVLSELHTLTAALASKQSCEPSTIGSLAEESQVGEEAHECTVTVSHETAGVLELCG